LEEARNGAGEKSWRRVTTGTGGKTLALHDMGGEEEMVGAANSHVPSRDKEWHIFYKYLELVRGVRSSGTREAPPKLLSLAAARPVHFSTTTFPQRLCYFVVFV
jgi:hypothetical protein